MTRVPVDRPIFVVDDDEATRMVMKFVLERSSLENNVIMFSDGESLMAHMHSAEKGAEARPALIFLDVNMPGLTGFEVLDRLRDEREVSHGPLIAMLSSSEATGDKVKSLSKGADAYLTKTAGISKFVAMIDNQFAPATTA